MRSQRFRRFRLGIALLATALLDAACFGGQPSAQATTTAGLPTPTALASPRPLLSPLALASPAASPSPGLAPGEQAYTVEAGDTLATVAQKFYNDSGLWRKIYDANKTAIGDNPDAIKAGTQLRIPPKE